MIKKEEIINAIVGKWGDNDSGCFINNKWFSPYAIIEFIKNLN